MPTGPLRIFEVGPRDGLQNERSALPTPARARFVRELAAAGLRDIEAASFVRPDKVPQMARSEAVFSALSRAPLGRGTRLWALVPNRVGLERARACGARGIAFFTAVSDTFNRANIGVGSRESLSLIRDLLSEASGFEIRVYVSTAFYCPFEGKIRVSRALDTIERLAALGIPEISVGDTIGAACPSEVRELLARAISIPGTRIAAHFHDTRGTALANAAAALESGVRVFDASAGGLGGCPFAPGASGNLATEDLAYFLQREGFRTGVDIASVARASLRICKLLGRPPASRVAAMLAGGAPLLPGRR